MSNIYAVAKREFVSYFITPVGYIVAGTFATISGLMFTLSFMFYAKVSVSPSTYAYTEIPDFEEMLLSPYLVFCGMLMMFIGPLVTMRLLAEERSRGTMELLLTHPLRDRDIVFGKYFASLGMLMVMMVTVIIHLCIVAYFVDVEPAVLVFGLLSVFLMGAAFLSLGLFVSSITSTQVTAATMSFGVWMVSYVLGVVAKDLPDTSPVPESWPQAMQGAVNFVYGIVKGVMQEIPLDIHAEEMAQGIVTPKDIVYYILFIAIFLFLTFRALESRKWRA